MREILTDYETYKHIAIVLTALLTFNCGYAFDINPELTRQHAEQLSHSNHAEEAINLYKELLSKNPPPEEKRTIQLDLAQAYVTTQQFSLALAEYDQLITDNPKDCEVRTILGDLYLSFARYDAQQNNHQSALNWYTAAIALDPRKRTFLLREYAEEVSKGGNGPDAVILYKEILSHNTLSAQDNRRVNLDLAQTYVWLNRSNEALEIYDNLLKNNPQDSEARKGKAHIYLAYARFDASQGNSAKAIEWYQKASELHPEEKWNFLKEYADQLRYNSRQDEAITLYQELLNNKPNKDTEREVQLSLASTYSEKFAYDDALKIYGNLLAQNKYDARAKQGLAKIYWDYANYNSRLGKPKNAIEWYYKALENNPIVRSELLLKIEHERTFLKEQDLPPKSSTEIAIEACAGNQTSDTHTTIPNEEKKTSVEQKSVIAPIQKPDSKNLAQTSLDRALEHAKNLEVFDANRAFEESLNWEPQNTNYREQYAWHLQTFSLFEEAVFQFEILLPHETDKIPYYDVLGWNYRRLGLLDQSIWAFSHTYHIPCYLTLNNQYLKADSDFHDIYQHKISELENYSLCGDETKSLEIKKKLFDYSTYVGDLDRTSYLASEILTYHPEEYLIHYHYAAFLYQKKKYPEALLQFQLLLEKLPDNAFLYLSLGKVLEDMGRTCSAESAYRYAFSLDRNPETERAFARILAKQGDCSDAYIISNSIVDSEDTSLTKALSHAEVSLNCNDHEDAACFYRSILGEYPYNQDALWGLLASSTFTGNSEDSLLSYRRWPNIWFDKPIQNNLASYYRPPEFILPLEYYYDSTSFTRLSSGLSLNKYAFDDIRIYAGAYYNKFRHMHFDTIERVSFSFSFDKLFNESWDIHCKVIENCYNPLQHHTTDPCKENFYSKANTNAYLHLTYHHLPEFSADIGYDYYDVIDTVPPFDNPIYNYSNQIGAISLNIRTSDVKFSLYYNKERVYWLANIVYGKYSDGNFKKTRSFRIGYKFSELPEFYAYYSYFYLDFSHHAPLFQQNCRAEGAYYDPKNLEIHSIGLTNRYDITEKLQVGGELALLYLPKVSNFGYSGFAYFNYQIADNLACRLDLRYYYQTKGVLRTGTSGYFYAENVNFQINYNF